MKTSSPSVGGGSIHVNSRAELSMSSIFFAEHAASRAPVSKKITPMIKIAPRLIKKTTQVRVCLIRSKSCLAFTSTLTSSGATAFLCVGMTGSNPKPGWLDFRMPGQGPCGSSRARRLRDTDVVSLKRSSRAFAACSVSRLPSGPRRRSRRMSLPDSNFDSCLVPLASPSRRFCFARLPSLAPSSLGALFCGRMRRSMLSSSPSLRSEIFGCAINASTAASPSSALSSPSSISSFSPLSLPLPSDLVCPSERPFGRTLRFSASSPRPGLGRRLA